MNLNTRGFWSRLLVILGGLVMLGGALDPMEGSPIILLGAILVTLGTFLGNNPRGLFAYWVGILVSIAVGVGALFALSVVGGIGGKSGHSMWWDILILPYPIAWVMGMVSLLFRSVRCFRSPSAPLASHHA
jgi:hypothetical protein